MKKDLVLIVKYETEETAPEKIKDSIICLEGVYHVN